MSVWAGYDLFLEEPYQAACRYSDELELIEDWVADEPHICDWCAAEVYPTAVRAENLSAWNNGAYSGGAADIHWECPECGEPHIYRWNQDSM